MDAREFRRERCTDMTQLEAMDAFAAYKVEEIAGGLAKALGDLRAAIRDGFLDDLGMACDKADAALAAYHEAVGHD